MLPLASRMPVSMASLLRSDSVNPFRNSSNYRGGKNKRELQAGCGGSFHSWKISQLVLKYFQV